MASEKIKIYNIALAGKKSIVPKSFHESGTLEFDEKGNLKTEVTKKVAEQLLNIPGYEEGESPMKPKKVEETPANKEKYLEGKLKIEEKAHAETKAKLEAALKELAELKKSSKESK